MTININRFSDLVLILINCILFTAFSSIFGIGIVLAPDPLILSLRDEPNSFLVLSDGENTRIPAGAYGIFQRSAPFIEKEVRHEIIGPSAHWRIVLGDLCQLPEIRRPAGDARQFAECEPLVNVYGNGRISRTDLGIWRLRECPSGTEFVMLLQVCLPRESAIRLQEQLCETPDPTEKFAFCSPENATANMWLPIQRTFTPENCHATATVPLSSSSSYYGASMYGYGQANNCPSQEVIEPCKLPPYYGEEFARMRSFPIAPSFGGQMPAASGLPPCPCPPTRTSCICIEAQTQRPQMFLDCCCEEKQAPPCLCMELPNQQPNLQNLGPSPQQPSQFVGQPQPPIQPPIGQPQAQNFVNQQQGQGHFGPSDSGPYPQPQPFSGGGYSPDQNQQNLGQPQTNQGGYGPGPGISSQPSFGQNTGQTSPYQSPAEFGSAEHWRPASSSSGPGGFGGGGVPSSGYGHGLPSSAGAPFSGGQGPNRFGDSGFYPYGLSNSVTDEPIAPVIQPQPCPLVQPEEIQRAKYQGICSWMLDPLVNDPDSRTHFLQCQPAPYNVLCGRWQRMPCSPSTVFDVKEQLCIWDLTGGGAQPGPLPQPGFGQPPIVGGGNYGSSSPTQPGGGGWQTPMAPTGGGQSPGQFGPSGSGQNWPSSLGLGTGGTGRPTDNLGVGPNPGQNNLPNIGPNILPNIGQNILPNAGPNFGPNVGQNIGGGLVGGPGAPQGQGGLPSGPQPPPGIGNTGNMGPNIGGNFGTGSGGGRKVLECTCRTGGIALGNCDPNLQCSTPQAVCHVGVVANQIPCNVCCFYRMKRRK